MKLDIKHSGQSTFKAKAIESDLVRETYKVEKSFKKKGNDLFFFNKDIHEIQTIVPDVSLTLHIMISS